MVAPSPIARAEQLKANDFTHSYNKPVRFSNNYSFNANVTWSVFTASD